MTRARTPLHGTLSEYMNGGCRCDSCTWERARASRVQRGRARPGDLDDLLPAPAWFDRWAESMASSL